MEEAVDATAKHEETGDERHRTALRTRNVSRYAPANLNEYKREFTTRRSRPSGALTEWDKIFGEPGSQEDAPDFMAYGWMHPNGGEIEDYVILSVKVLRDLHASGQLESCIVDKRENRDWRRSSFVAISLPCVQESSDSAAVEYQNPTHPGLPPA